jgi:hypothetical protein
MSAGGVAPLYTFRPEGDQRRYRCTFYVGTTPAGDQALAFVTNDEWVRLRFSAAGDLLEVVRRPHDPVEPGTANVLAADERFPGQAALRAWMDEVGLIDGPIRVKQFLLPDSDEPVGIARFPRYMLELMEDPYLRPDPDERRQVFRGIREWVARRDFVVRGGAGSEVFVADDGRSVST